MPFDPPPSPEEVATLSDPAELHRLREDIEQAIVQIETDLEWRDADAVWEQRARNALSRFRYAKRLVGKRLGAVVSAPPLSQPRELLDPLGAELLAGWRVDIDGIETVDAARAAADALVQRINALTADNENEKARPAHARDREFIARASAVLREAASQRVRLSERRGDLAKAERQAEHERSQHNREHRFIQAAKSILAPETYRAVWAEVERTDAGL